MNPPFSILIATAATVSAPAATSGSDPGTIPGVTPGVTPGLARFTALDWAVLLGYMVIVVIIGVAVSMKRRGADDFFLAGRRIPMWAAAVSVLATSMSAATFLGGPQQAYAGNLTYFAVNLAALLAVVLSALFFIPTYYRLNVTSIYEVLGRGLGVGAQRAATVMFMIGRVFASGARLFMVGIPFSTIVFGDTDPQHLALSIVLISVGATAYTMVGGIRAVIWTDVLQAMVFISCVVIALVWIMVRVPVPAGDVYDALAATRHAGGTKLLVLDTQWSLTNQYTLPAILIGWTLFFLAAFGADHDLVQRMLTCRSAKRGAWSVIVSNLLTWPVVALFLLIGLLLYVFYERSDLMGDAAPGYTVMDQRQVFLEFILHEMGAGMRGLMVAGLFAAAMSTLDSTLNALASTTVTDFYRPYARRRSARAAERAGAGHGDSMPRTSAATPDRAERWVSRLAVMGWAIVLADFAFICITWQTASGKTLIDFALGVMLYAYTGLLAVFMVTLWTRRGNSVSAITALLTGFVTILTIQMGWLDGVLRPLLDDAGLTSTARLAMPWQMVIGTGLSAGVCVVGRRTAE